MYRRPAGVEAVITTYAAGNNRHHTRHTYSYTLASSMIRLLCKSWHASVFRRRSRPYVRQAQHAAVVAVT